MAELNNSAVILPYLKMFRQVRAKKICNNVFKLVITVIVKTKSITETLLCKNSSLVIITLLSTSV